MASRAPLIGLAQVRERVHNWALLPLNVFLWLTLCCLRRMILGRHLAEISIFISCVMALAVFDISKSVENGIVNKPVHENTTGTIR